MSSFNKEIEMRFFLDKFPEKLKGIPSSKAEEVDEYFTNDAIAKEGRLYLRIRTRSGKRVLELKEVISGGRITRANENLINILEEDYETLKYMLETVLPVKIVIKKIREKIKFNDCEICIDDVESLGKFIEIEGPEEKIMETCKILDIDMNKIEDRGGYVKMMLRKMGFPQNFYPSFKKSSS